MCMRVYRLYREDGLSLRLKRPRRSVSAANRERQPAASAPNEVWSMDFVSDALFDGRRLRALTVVDAFTHEALAIDVDQGIKGEQVVEVMKRVASLRGAPRAIRVVNGPQLVSKALDKWAYENGVMLDFSRPGKPTDHAFVESFNGRLRDVPVRSLVPVAGRCGVKDRGLATGIQREPASQVAWLADADGICYAVGHTGRRMNAGSLPQGWTRSRRTLMNAGSVLDARSKSQCFPRSPTGLLGIGPATDKWGGALSDRLSRWGRGIAFEKLRSRERLISIL